MGALQMVLSGINAFSRAVTSYTEAFTGTTGAAWPTSPNTWTSRQEGTGYTRTIQSNAGQLSTGNTTSFAGVRAALENVSFTNCTVLVSITPNGNGYTSVFLGGQGTGSGIYGHYVSPIGISVEIDQAGSQFVLYETASDGATPTTIQTATGQTFTQGTKYNVRLQQTGTTVRARWWAASGSEGSTWTVTGTASKAYTGFVGVGVQNAGTTQNTSTFDDFTATTP